MEYKQFETSSSPRISRVQSSDARFRPSTSELPRNRVLKKTETSSFVGKTRRSLSLVESRG
ncbi:hypothetical protein QQP08_012769 [Theobroma cacao]|nr:hypothetical protein QQP08_012769 [Theobroma cacao]